MSTTESNELRSGNVAIRIADWETEMGTLAADRVVEELLGGSAAGKQPVLWLMAAPSGFAFYEALIRRAKREYAVRELLSGIPIYQFDDYPIARESSRFPVTFRHLLEERVVTPLRERAGVSGD